MEEIGLEEIKKVEYGILCRFDEFCRENSIQYFLSNGTLLGAIKYRGFIPWDDDVDVLVPRKDYDRLIKIYEDTQRFKLFSFERNNDFKFTFAKLCDMSTIKRECNTDSKIQLGLDIDIFPLDSCTSHVLRKSVFYRIKQYHLGCVLSKFQSVYGKSFYKKLIIRYCQMRGFCYFREKLISIVKKESSKGNEKSGCLLWPIYGRKEIVNSNLFSSSVLVTFEGGNFPAPIGYETYLRSLYGDYQLDPPIEKQKTHHSFVAYKVTEKD